MTVVVVLSVSAAIMIVVVVGVFLGTRRLERTARPAARNPEPAPEPMSSHPAPGRSFVVDAGILDPRTIKVGDTVDRQGVRARVLGALHLSWQGDQWTEYLLEEGVRHYQWLSVEERDGATPDDPPHLEVYLWTPVPTQGMVPAKSMLIMEGVEFSPIERGTAAFRSEGMTGYPDRGLVDFADYRAQDGRLLSFSRVQGQSWTAAYAQPLSPGSLTVERTL
ncbi:hypothetical protein Skr01_44660 [Sphaerisporangium krabiense]|uniref:DUF4178 domain-containing protein n=1 Tax=Sphaerisporangium krabiense TaxID=763782 RepID=A0A7W8Z586_9ACTN|nr:DUF4178 domain-containing protein [Sphaerisporangium krabiense]MBB5627480.1 hypothetical protein [Sphaerisporangium krabiense]GII64381.1 hypothetical protein Skr01_44660 [Sphaerisporangium krabiense]